MFCVKGGRQRLEEVQQPCDGEESREPAFAWADIFGFETPSPTRVAHVGLTQKGRGVWVVCPMWRAARI